MTFNYKGENLFLEKYLKTHTWPCLKERIEIAVTWQQNVTFKITSSVKKAKTRFSLVFEPWKTIIKRQEFHSTISMARLQLIDGIYYPQERVNRTYKLAKTYRTLMQFSRAWGARRIICMGSPWVTVKREIIKSASTVISYYSTLTKQRDTRQRWINGNADQKDTESSVNWCWCGYQDKQVAQSIYVMLCKTWLTV